MPARSTDACPHMFPPGTSPRAVPATGVPFAVRTAHLGTTALVHFDGELDMDAEPAARAALARATRRPYDMLGLMLDDVTFFACCGLALLLHARQETARHHAALALIAPSPPMLCLLDVSDLTGAFTLHATVADALAARSRRP
ncbi:anti-sigma factor antagonist [Kitasatospora sp. NPDC090308]|uniref:anti-sigma factor antagonist n=1 Tax=Kitasatospora sp. NPDC090308 TaxID=3364082 RepID=UPI00381697C2